MLSDWIFSLWTSFLDWDVECILLIRCVMQKRHSELNNFALKEEFCIKLLKIALKRFKNQKFYDTLFVNRIQFLTIFFACTLWKCFNQLTLNLKKNNILKNQRITSLKILKTRKKIFFLQFNVFLNVCFKHKWFSRYKPIYKTSQQTHKTSKSFFFNVSTFNIPANIKKQ